jgi:hypothetical protein
MALEAPRPLETATAEQKDTSPVGLGQTAAPASTVALPAPSASETMAAETPPEPREGQATPDAKGRCPHKRQVALNGGCWAETPVEQEKCEVFSGYMYKGMCYVPIFPKGRRPSTSTPTEKP